MNTAILIFQSKDHRGLIHRITEFIYKHNGNIIDLDQHSTEDENGEFFQRAEFCFSPSDYSFSYLRNAFKPIADEFDATWYLVDKSEKLKMGILASKPDHCLAELLYRVQSGEINVEIPFVLSNYDVHKRLVSQYDIRYFHIPASSGDRKESDILKVVGDTDFLVLARYMQILSGDFLRSYGKPIINIHHSFLPSFKGGNPYKQAWDRGVKLIGATAHFVTEDLDEGPIIDQKVVPVSHRDSVNDLKLKGKNLEKQAVGHAVQLYADHRVVAHRNKTIVFE